MSGTAAARHTALGGPGSNAWGGDTGREGRSRLRSSDAGAPAQAGAPAWRSSGAAAPCFSRSASPSRGRFASLLDAASRTTSSIRRRALPDPELLEERCPERVVLVVAHAL